eukprot:Clim_evm44s148 gene=Clim_evmTU44s148
MAQRPSHQRASLDTLPQDVFDIISGYLLRKDLLELCKVSKGLYQLSNHSARWMQSMNHISRKYLIGFNYRDMFERAVEASMREKLMVSGAIPPQEPTQAIQRWGLEPFRDLAFIVDSTPNLAALDRMHKSAPLKGAYYQGKHLNMAITTARAILHRVYNFQQIMMPDLGFLQNKACLVVSRGPEILVWLPRTPENSDPDQPDQQMRRMRKGGIAWQEDGRKGYYVPDRILSDDQPTREDVSKFHLWDDGNNHTLLAAGHMDGVVRIWDLTYDVDGPGYAQFPTKRGNYISGSGIEGNIPKIMFNSMYERPAAKFEYVQTGGVLCTEIVRPQLQHTPLLCLGTRQGSVIVDKNWINSLPPYFDQNTRPPSPSRGSAEQHMAKRLRKDYDIERGCAELTREVSGRVKVIKALPERDGYIAIGTNGNKITKENDMTPVMIIDASREDLPVVNELGYVTLKESDSRTRVDMFLPSTEDSRDPNRAGPSRPPIPVPITTNLPLPGPQARLMTAQAAERNFRSMSSYDLCMLDSNLCISGSYDARVCLWDLRDRNNKRTPSAFANVPEDVPVYSVHGLVNQPYIAVGMGQHACVRILDLRRLSSSTNSRFLNQRAVLGPSPWATSFYIEQYSKSSVYKVQFSGRFLFAATSQTVRFLDFDSRDHPTIAPSRESALSRKAHGFAADTAVLRAQERWHFDQATKSLKKFSDTVKKPRSCAFGKPMKGQYRDWKNMDDRWFRTGAFSRYYNGIYGHDHRARQFRMNMRAAAQQRAPADEFDEDPFFSRSMWQPQHQ